MGYSKLNKKVFDYCKMPEDVQEAFVKELRDSNQRGQYGLIERDVYRECYDGTESYINNPDGEVIWRDCEDDGGDLWDKDSKMILIRGEDIISDWLLDNGGEFWEEILIDYPL